MSDTRTAIEIGVGIGIEELHDSTTCRFDSDYDPDFDSEFLFATSDVQTQTQTSVDMDIPWNVIVWDDPVNLMTYVVYVLKKVFGYNQSLATKLMLEVHNEGKSLVATEEREQAEHHAHQLHTYGLQATIRRAE